MNFSVIEQLAEVEMEVRRRRRHYPTWVKSGALSEDSCNLRIARMENVAETLRSLIAIATKPGESQPGESQPAAIGASPPE